MCQDIGSIDCELFISVQNIPQLWLFVHHLYLFMWLISLEPETIYTDHNPLLRKYEVPWQAYTVRRRGISFVTREVQTQDLLNIGIIKHASVWYKYLHTFHAWCVCKLKFLFQDKYYYGLFSHFESCVK